VRLQPDAVQEFERGASASSLWIFGAIGPDATFRSPSVREQVERLKDQPDARRTSSTRRPVIGSRIHAINDEAAVLLLLKAVDAANERRLPKPRGPMMTNNLLIVVGEVDPLQRHDGTIPTSSGR